MGDMRKRFKVGDKVRKGREFEVCVIDVGRFQMFVAQFKSGEKKLKTPYLLHWSEKGKEALMGLSAPIVKVGRCSVSEVKRGKARYKEIGREYKKSGIPGWERGTYREV